MSKIKDYFNAKTPEQIFSCSMFVSCFVLMIVLAIFRFCGIGYFANDYEIHEQIPAIQELILFVFKWFEGYFILAMLSRMKWWNAISVSFIWSNIYWFVDSAWVCMILDTVYIVLLPFILSKFKYRYVTYGLIVYILISIYQLIMMQARYTINIEEKFNYIAMIASTLDYKLFIVSMYLFIKNWRLNMERINTPNPNDEKNYGGGGCFLWWGKFEDVCEKIGLVIVSICTLGIVPLSVYIYRKAKAKNAEEN